MAKITIDEVIPHFVTDKWKIPTDHYPKLDAVVDTLKKYPALRVNVIGHTDWMDGRRWNDILSKWRAESVEKYLLEKGVPAGQINEVYGVADTQPRVPGKHRAANRENRRVEVHAVKPIEVPEDQVK